MSDFALSFSRCAAVEFITIFSLCLLNAYLERFENVTSAEKAKKIISFLLIQVERVLKFTFSMVDHLKSSFSNIFEKVINEVEGSSEIFSEDEVRRFNWSFFSSIFIWILIRVWSFNIFAHLGYENPEEIRTFFVFFFVFVFIPSIFEAVNRIGLKNSEQVEEIFEEIEEIEESSDKPPVIEYCPEKNSEGSNEIESN